MRPTVRLGQVRGIDIGLHWTIALIAVVLTLTLRGSVLPDFAPGYGSTAYLLAGLGTTLLFLGSIVAHELGHSLVALRNQVRVKSITLFALGGVAALDGEPARPGPAARIALAGPAVSVAVGAGAIGTAVAVDAIGLPALLAASLAWLGVINVMLAVFNMLPALPLDGGRVLQAYLWRRQGDRHRATISAARLGRWIGWVLVAVGFLELTQGGNGLFTMLIGWFVAGTARAEGARAEAELQRERQPFPFGPFGPYGGGPSAGSPFGTGPYSGRPFADGPFGPGPADRPIDVDSWPAPRPEDRHPGSGPVIDVDGYPLGRR